MGSFLRSVRSPRSYGFFQRGCWERALLRPWTSALWVLSPGFGQLPPMCVHRSSECCSRHFLQLSHLGVPKPSALSLRQQASQDPSGPLSLPRVRAWKLWQSSEAVGLNPGLLHLPLPSSRTYVPVTWHTGPCNLSFYISYFPGFKKFFDYFRQELKSCPQDFILYGNRNVKRKM